VICIIPLFIVPAFADDLYVSASQRDRVLVFQGSTGTFIADFVTVGSGGLDIPEGMTFGPDFNSDGHDDLYVATNTGTANGNVLVYDGKDGTFLGIFVDGSMNPLATPIFDARCLVFGPDANADTKDDLYACNRLGDNILVYDGTNGAFISEFITAGSGGLDAPFHLAFQSGDVFVASFATDQVLRYDGTGNFLSIFVVAGDNGLDAPTGVLFHTDGFFYVSSGFTKNAIQKHQGLGGASPGTFVADFVTDGSGGLFIPHKFLFNGGDLFATSAGTDQILRYDGTTGAFIGVFACTDLECDSPAELLFGPDTTANTCDVPSTGLMDITSSCVISSFVSSNAPGNVIVRSGAVMTIESGVTFDINFSNFNLTVESGGGVLIKAGGKIT